MTHPFTAPPASVGKTYGQHLRFALRFGPEMLAGVDVETMEALDHHI